MRELLKFLVPSMSCVLLSYQKTTLLKMIAQRGIL